MATKKKYKAKPSYSALEQNKNFIGLGKASFHGILVAGGTIENESITIPKSLLEHLEEVKTNKKGELDGCKYKDSNKSSVTCFIGTEVTMGTPTANDGTWHKAPTLDFSWSDGGSALSVAPMRSNGMGQGFSGGRHTAEDTTSEISLTLKGTAATINRLCLTLFGDGTNPNALLGNSLAGTAYKHGVANAIPVTLLFDDGGTNGNDIYFTSCLCTSLDLSYSIASDGGMLIVTATFLTGYVPTQGTLTPASSTDLGTGVAFNIHSLSTHTYAAQELMVHDFSLNIARAVTKAGGNPDGSYAPFGYNVGGYEVTGSITAKRDENSAACITNNTAQALAFADGTFEVQATKCLIDSASVGFDDTGLTTTLPFRCFYDDAAEDNPVVTIHTA